MGHKTRLCAENDCGNTAIPPKELCDSCRAVHKKRVKNDRAKEMRSLSKTLSYTRPKRIRAINSSSLLKKSGEDFVRIVNAIMAGEIDFSR